ncbi:MAG: D-glycero-beta-D-manno-heptose 1,7-bisphosphate 7-phosphatase [Armatimonadota bacterium]|nr:D-glycero-beta-D-manno-heptose 1,7-bisphosphate 7-phosphatase [Armatimonadota bacterium]
MLSAVFLDRDGVINENREDYVKSLDELRFLPGVIGAIGRLTAAGFRVVVVSNQQGVAKGVIRPEALDEIDQALASELSAIGSRVGGVYYCPHLQQDNCACRKPKPGLLFKAASDMGFDVTRSILVGDSPKDVQAGRAAGCKTILALSGKTSPDEVAHLALQPDHIVADLAEAADLILREYGPDEVRS